RLEHPEVGDHGDRPTTSQPEPSAVARAGPVPERRDEIEALDEALARLSDDDDHLRARGGDLRGAARAWETDDRRGVRRADDSRVDVGEAIDLRGAEEPDVDPPGLQPVVEDLDEPDDRVGRLGKDAVTDRERQVPRLRSDRARLV